MKRILICVSAIALLTSGAAAQGSDVQSGFEVASIRVSSDVTGQMQIGVSPSGVFTAQNVTLKTLIQQAYDIRSFQISGGPSWLDTQTYDVTAKAGNTAVSEDDIRKMTSVQRDAFKQQFSRMLQSLLADRFQLKMHLEVRELPVYAMVATQTSPMIRSSKNNAGSVSRLTMRPVEGGQVEITGTGVPLASLIKALSNQLDRVVLDQTGMDGQYDFKLVFSRDSAPALQGGQEPTTSSENGGPSLFTALPEQLGLKLEAQKGPVQMLVVDSAQKPSAN
jgi:uncharacterized protein (TIGR03435 family)